MPPKDLPRSKQLRNIIDDESQKKQRKRRGGGDRPRHMGPPPGDFDHYNPRQQRGRDDFEVNRPPHMRDG